MQLILTQKVTIEPKAHVYDQASNCPSDEDRITSYDDVKGDDEDEGEDGGDGKNEVNHLQMVFEVADVDGGTL